MSYDETKPDDLAIMERCRRVFADFGLADRLVVGKEPTLLLEEWHLLHSQVFTLFTRGPLMEALGLAWSLASLDEQDAFLCNVLGCTPDFDMQDTAAVIQQLDVVITVDSAIAHLAGALGKPVWMLNRTAGCWRWGWDGAERTPWYGSMRIFTQSEPYQWRPVIDEVRRELAGLT